MWSRGKDGKSTGGTKESSGGECGRAEISTRPSLQCIPGSEVLACLVHEISARGRKALQIITLWGFDYCSHHNLSNVLPLQAIKTRFSLLVVRKVP